MNRTMTLRRGTIRASLIAMTLAAGLAQAGTPASLSVYQPNGVAANPQMVLVSTPFCNPGSLVTPPLNLPRQILRFNPTGGAPTVFSDLSTLPNANIACSSDGTAGFGSYLAISPGLNGFPANEVYVLLGNDIYQIPPSGGAATFFVKLPNSTHGLTFDTVGAFGNNLVVTTRSGNTASALYTVTSTGKISKSIATVNTVLENPVIAPYNFGIITKGDTVVTGEDGNVYDITPTGTVQTFATGFNYPGSVDFIPQQICAYYGAVLGPFPINQENQLNPNPSVVQILNSSFFAGHSGLMIVRDEGFVPPATGSNITAVSPSGAKMVIGTAPGEQEQGVFVTTCVALACPTGTGQVGTPYSSSLVPSGGVPPYTFSIIAGSLPPGLKLNSSTGAITGTPSMPGTFSFTAQAVDSTGTPTGTATSNCSITISASPLTLVCPQSTGQVGIPYSSSLVAAGGVPPYTYSIASGSLPPGLTLNPATGAITGIPSSAGTFAFTAKVVDSASTTTTVNCGITIAKSTLALTCAMNTGQVGVAYSSALTATGGTAPYRFSITSGALPPGLKLNVVTGAITGTPTTNGTYNYTAQVIDSKGTKVTRNCTIVIAPPPLTLSCPSGTGGVGTPYSSALTATGGAPPYTFSISSGVLPTGLTLNTSTGAITGTPTKGGTFNFSAKVVDSLGKTVGIKCSIIIAQVIVTCPTNSGQVGVPYSSGVSASGGVAPYTFSIIAGALPPGLTLSNGGTAGIISGATITGTPTQAGVFNFTLQAVDSSGLPSGTGTSNCTITILPPPLTLACPNAGQVKQPYTSGLQAMGGVPPYTFSITAGTLPPGLTLNTKTGAITGTPTKAGTYSVTFQVTDSFGPPPNTATANCNIIIAPPNVLSSCLPTSSLSVLVHNKSAAAYIPNGSWSESGTGVQFVPLEGTKAARALIPTPAPVNSCSSNWVTGQTVCTGNATDVYLITATTLTNTLQTSGFGTSFFTGGECTNCGVAIDAATNNAVIATSAGEGIGALQFLNLANNTFGELISVPEETSENIAVDPVRNLVLSPNEGNNTGLADYQIYQFGATNELYSFADASKYFQGDYGDELDSAAEDCTTGIALSTDEFTGNIFITDLTQIVFNPATATWTAPSQLQDLPEFANLAAGTSGIAVAPGSHYAVVTGEFCCGGLFGAIQIPSNAGVGTPSVLDYVAANIPPDPSGTGWNNGLDPHTVTAYVSPNTGRALAVMANDQRSYVALVDLQALLAAPRISGTHYLSPKVNMVKTGILRWVSIPAPYLFCPTPSAWDTNLYYSSALTAVGVTPPNTFSIIGSLPPGLALDPNSGSITGTPTTVGNYSFTGQVVDSTGQTLTNSCSINISAGPAVTCPTSTGIAGVPYSSTTALPGGAPPLNYYLSSGSLPPGLSLDSGTGNIAGSPTTAGTYNFTVTVTDALGLSATTDGCTITIAPPPLTVVAPLSSGQLTIAYFSQVITGGAPPYSPSISSGSLPPGLTANTSGTITGTPTATGSYTFTLTVTDSAKTSASGTETITVGTVDPNVLASCQTANGMSVLAQGTAVNAYVPNGSWGEYNSGIQLVPLEGTGTSLTTISTPDPVNSCASNWATGQTVCTGNNNEVYLVSGSSVTSTLSAGGYGQQYFTGGQCTSCAVAIDASTNQAVLEVAQNYGGGALQFLDLNTNTFGALISIPGQTAENVGLDPFHHLVLSPNQGIYGPPNYSIYETQPGTYLYSFANIFNFFGYYDYLASGAEDCSTGIAVSTQEGYANLFLTDLTQATFDPVQLVWNAPAQVQYMYELYSLSDASSGIAIAGESHLGVITGEFCCGSGFAGIQLPASSGSGTPSVTDYVVAFFPNDPSGNYWQNSIDPHRVTAYVSPNTGKALAVVGNDPRTYLAVVDLQALLNAPRQPGSHYIDGSVDLIGTGIVKWVAASQPALSCPYPSEWYTSTAYSANVGVTGGFPPYTFSVTGGSLPSGLTLSSSGTLSGTPSATGTFNYTVQVVDSTGTAAGTGSTNCSITIAAPIALTAPTASAQAGVAYSSVVGISGGFPPYYSYIYSGSLPPGLSLDYYAATVTGTPLLAGVYNFAVYVYDSSGTSAGYSIGNFTITVAPAPLITSCPLSTAQKGLTYFSSVVSGGLSPYQVSITGGSLPPGLAANSSGVINGVPTSNGSYSFGIQVSDSAGTSSSVSGCSITVSAPSPAVLSSCQPANSISVLAQGSTVTAYYPAGDWDDYINNIYVVPLEGGGSKATISTSTPVNSCASNWSTGQTVCTDNYSGVYLINGTSISTTLTSSAFGYNYNTDGYCTNCGVAIDAGANKALISEALGYSYPGGIQLLDLATNTFESAVTFNATASEAPLVDPLRHLVLAPTEGYGYLIYRAQPAAGTFNFANTSYTLPYYNDSAAEDCTTGLILSTNEYDETFFIADLSQGTFDPIAGQWNAPSQNQYLPELAYNLASGPSGIAIAQGSHLGIVTGEFCCGGGFGAIQLPATSGSGTPGIVDWVEANLPNDPSGNSWSNGYGPHTVTAYVSPNTGKSLGVIGNQSRTYLALIDIQALLSALRQAGTHYLDPSVDLVGSGILTWVSVQ